MIKVERLSKQFQDGAILSEISFEINIFSNVQNKITQVREIRNTIDSLLTGVGMTRDYSNPIPNYSDLNLYRYILRYTCVVDSNKKIFRR